RRGYQPARGGATGGSGRSGIKSGFSEIHNRRALNIVPGHRDDTLFVTPDRNQDVDDIQRKTGAQLGAAVAQADSSQVFAAIFLERDVAACCYAPEDFVEGMLVDRLDEDLVVDTAQKGFIRQIVGVEVGGEHDHHFERDLELYAVLQ